MGEGFKLTVDTMVPGYKPSSWRASLRPQAFNEVRVPVRAQADIRRGEVRLQAGFAGGASYTGPLLVAFKRGAQELQYPLDFDSGVASTTLSVPVGDYQVRCSGLSTQGEWWRPASQSLHLQVSEGVPALAELLLTGNRARITVKDSSGRRVHGFDLGVGKPGPSHGWGHILGDWDARLGAPEVATVWIPEGTVLIRAEMEGVGLGEAFVNASGDGTALDVEIVLDPNRSTKRRRR